MKIPKYWAKGEIDRKNINPATGETTRFWVWGSSDVSPAQAAENGRTRAREVAAMIDRGERPDRYTYGSAIREKVTAEWKTGGETVAALTINAYGADIINTSQVMFVDVDISTPAQRAKEEATALARLDEVIHAKGDFGAHVYRTAAGLRYILTLAGHPPQDPFVGAIMKDLGSDPLYVMLCRVQECYRARLTPKPWRLGLSPLGVRYPYSNGAMEKYVKGWRDRYLKASSDYAVCESIGYRGPAVRTTDDLAQVVEYHDRVTKARSGLQLA